MELLRFLLTSNYRMATLIAVAGVASGLFSAGLIALINTGLHATESMPMFLAAGIVVVALGKVASGVLSSWFLYRYAQQLVLELSVELCRKILAAPFRLLEETGGHRLLTTLTTDVAMLTAGLVIVPKLVVNLAVVLGAACYLLWLYPTGFAGLVLVLLGGALTYKLLHSKAFSAILLARESRDGLMHAFRTVTDGLKELKMSRARRDELLSIDVDGAASRVRHYNLVATRNYLTLDAWSQILFYAMIASVVLLFPRDGPQAAEVLSGFIFAGLYVMNPIWAIIGAAPTFANGVASLRKIDKLGLRLVEETGKGVDAGVELALQRLTLDEVEFSYAADTDQEEAFKLGPISFSIQPGEIVFVVGGNGSGKTTFMKVLAGLYVPTGGEILIDDKLIPESDYQWYRDHFSIVFSDFFLFDRLLGTSGPDVDETANQYIADLELSDKVEIIERTFSTTKLSQGQRKRLALLTALMEARPICIFDEWAADQDPRYKEIFYTHLLPKLKADGRAVVVVTHDDRYFHLGDRLVRLEDGVVSQ